MATLRNITAEIAESANCKDLPSATKADLSKAHKKKKKKNKKKGKKIEEIKMQDSKPNPETVEIKVPEGFKAGNEMVIEGHLGKFKVNVPEGMKEGDVFHIEIKEPNPEPDMVTVKVPKGVKAGEEMVIEGKLGKFKVNVPAGMKEGDKFHVAVDKAHAEPENVVTVKVPEDTKVGDIITIDGDFGKFKVAIPEGMEPGDEFQVKIEKPNDEADSKVE